MTGDIPVAGLDLFVALETLRSTRHLSARPVPPAAVERLIYYATRAATGGNSQPWEFVVITDRAKVAAIARLYREVAEPAFQKRADQAPDERTRRVYRSAVELARRMQDVPCLILVCRHGPPPTDPERALPYYGSIFPAVQNLMLAARALGLGTTMTTIHKLREPEIKALLGIPADVATICLIPVGYPERPFTRITGRRDPAEVTHWEGW